MKNITSHRHSSGETIVGAKVNTGIREHSEIFNGALGANEIPSNSIDRDNLPGNAYCTYKQNSNGFQGLFSITSDEASSGWVAIGAGGAKVHFSSHEGFCRGAACATIRNVPYSHGPPGVITAGLSWESHFVRLGVFYNGALVAETEPITHSMVPVELPFCFPVNSGTAKLQMKIYIGPNPPGSATTIVDILNFWIWAKGGHA